jgi:hypothetical protein
MFPMAHQYPACLQCGTSDEQWNGERGCCHACGYDDVGGFCPVPSIYDHFLKSVLAASPQRIEPGTPGKLMAEFRRVFPTPEELADGWNFLREHPHLVIDVLRSAHAVH